MSFVRRSWRRAAFAIVLVGVISGCAPRIDCPPNEVARKELLCPPCSPTNPCPRHEGWVCREDPRSADERRRRQSARQAEEARAREEAARRQAEEAERHSVAERRRAEERAVEEEERLQREQPVLRAYEAPPAAPPPPPPRRGKCAAGPGRCCLEDGTIIRPCGPIGRPGCDKYTSLCGSGGFCHGCRCLPPDARVLTPAGEVEIAKLRTGDPIMTVSADGRRTRATVLRVARQSVVTAHEMVVLHLDGGRTVRGSALHPLADGRALGGLKLGDRVDGSVVTALSREPFAGDATWDLLPTGETGIYFIDGVPLGSTLRPGRVRHEPGCEKQIE
jgi:hypothetical protein